MEELFEGKPARFPANNTEEQVSVYKLMDLLNKTYIKPDPKLIDKFPNTDGQVTITDFEQYPIGKIDIQIKTLPNKNIDNPKYQCDVKFLKYCEVCLSPVILILVNAENEIAYWFHFSRETLVMFKRDLVGNSINVDIPKTNIISRTDEKYVSEWTTILQSYISRKIDSEIQSQYKTRYEELYNELKDFPKPIHTIGKEGIKALSLFIDTLNNALDNDFQAVKEVKYRDFWKMSITYTEFNSKSVAFSLVPIPWGTNDLLIREALHLRQVHNNYTLSTDVYFNRENPILANPVTYAYSWIKHDVSEILDNRALVLYTEELATEYVTDFFDYYHSILPLQFVESASVSEYMEIVNFYLPMLIEEYAKMRNKGTVHGDLGIDFDLLRAHLNKKDTKYLNEATQARIDRGERSGHKIKDLGKVTRYEKLQISLKVLHDLGITEVQRPYKPKGLKKQILSVWDFYSSEDAFDKISYVYQALPAVYDAFVNAFFPSLFGELNFYKDAQLLIVNVNYSESYSAHHGGPSIDLLFLQTDSTVTHETRIFRNGNNSPILIGDSHKHFDEYLTIDGVKYLLTKSLSRSARLLFEPYMLSETLREFVIERFRKFFESRL